MKHPLEQHQEDERRRLEERLRAAIAADHDVLADVYRRALAGDLDALDQVEAEDYGPPERDKGTCRIPEHLRTYDWYAPHQAWLRDLGLGHHDPGPVPAAERADLSGANLTGARLTGAKLTGAKLNRANLTGAKLTGAKLTGARLTGARLTGARLTGARLTGARLTGAKLNRANLNRANLTGANLEDAWLNRADLTYAYLSGARLTRADLTYADLSGARLNRANLTYADLSGANLEDANLEDAKLEGAKLAGAVMPDGRVWEQYRLDHYAGICDSAEVRARADAAWGRHKWGKCPMSAALGIEDVSEIDHARTRLLVACWVALYDAGLLPHPMEVQP